MESAEVYNRYVLAIGSPDRGFDEEVAAGRLDVLVGREVVLCHSARLEQGGVAQVVRHHDGRVQGGEVQRGNRQVVVA
jgi:hypothetical protein